MNAIAIQKILKKYDKVHGSVIGRNFMTEMHDKRNELLQSQRLIELGFFIDLIDLSSNGETEEEEQGKERRGGGDHANGSLAAAYDGRIVYRLPLESDSRLAA
ncbi:uncharacterized protein A4U43_C09F10390 [Asparagus officinalis]|uniref:RING-type E3 ubiquitin transferase n=1 Tax=Asparagus officinalis TaxID=4686 RepID=A0A5P1E6U4_ASPOF|nr:uncharacterized protein A4U43_C09F10390 [Asparagus officinalis]